MLCVFSSIGWCRTQNNIHAGSVNTICVLFLFPLRSLISNKHMTYDTIPRQELRQHLQRTRMPASSLSIIQDKHDADEYNLRMERRLLKCTLTQV